MSLSNYDHFPKRPMFVVDWDSTCVDEVWPGMGDWLPGAVEALKKLASIGNTCIYSVRCSLYEIDCETPRKPEDIQFEMDRVRAKLDEAGLQEVYIYPPNRGKPPGKYFIDDRAVRFTGDWKEVLDFVSS